MNPYTTGYKLFDTYIEPILLIVYFQFDDYSSMSSTMGPSAPDSLNPTASGSTLGESPVPLSVG